MVDGWALEIALRHCYEILSELADLSRTAICCRVTPSQKAQVVIAETHQYLKFYINTKDKLCKNIWKH